MLRLGHAQPQSRPDPAPCWIAQDLDPGVAARQFLGAVAHRVVDQQQLVVLAESIQVGNPAAQGFFEARSITLSEQQDAERLRCDRRQLRRFRHRLARRLARRP